MWTTNQSLMWTLTANAIKLGPAGTLLLAKHLPHVESDCYTYMLLPKLTKASPMCGASQHLATACSLLTKQWQYWTTPCTHEGIGVPVCLGRGCPCRAGHWGSCPCRPGRCHFCPCRGGRWLSCPCRLQPFCVACDGSLHLNLHTKLPLLPWKYAQMLQFRVEMSQACAVQFVVAMQLHSKAVKSWFGPHCRVRALICE